MNENDGSIANYGPSRLFKGGLSQEQVLALGHALSALAMSRQWSEDMGYPAWMKDDEMAIKVINNMLQTTAFYTEDPIKELCSCRNSWPKALA